jgi:hypothetical protein
MTLASIFLAAGKGFLTIENKTTPACQPRRRFEEL